jgi:hypothetical protein
MSSGRHQCHNDANTQMENNRRRLLDSYVWNAPADACRPDNVMVYRFVKV